MEYTLVSADSHLSLPPGFFRTYLPERHRDHPWIQTIEGMQKASLKMAGMGLAHMAGRRFEDYREKDISEDDIKPAAFEPRARLEAMDQDGVDAEVLISGGAAPTGDGVDELWEAIERHRKHLESTGRGRDLRRRRLASEIEQMAAEVLKQRVDRLVRECQGDTPTGRVHAQIVARYSNQGTRIDAGLRRRRV